MTDARAGRQARSLVLTDAGHRDVLQLADKKGQPWRAEAQRDCGPHSYATRERIVTAWTEKPL